MRKWLFFLPVIILLASLSGAETPAPTLTLTITVGGMNSAKGVLGIVIFRSANGWPENVAASFRHTAFAAQQGTQIVRIDDLPPGRYAVALIHDVNENKRLDKNWMGRPKEQWGMSNNPRAGFGAPSFDKAVFDLTSDRQISVTLQ
jgi:uncharacterized protein (DUF2141 family)